MLQCYGLKKQIHLASFSILKRHKKLIAIDFLFVLEIQHTMGSSVMGKVTVAAATDNLFREGTLPKPISMTFPVFVQTNTILWEMNRLLMPV